MADLDADGGSYAAFARHCLCVASVAAATLANICRYKQYSDLLVPRRFTHRETMHKRGGIWMNMPTSSPALARTFGRPPRLGSRKTRGGCFFRKPRRSEDLTMRFGEWGTTHISTQTSGLGLSASSENGKLEGAQQVQQLVLKAHSPPRWEQIFTHPTHPTDFLESPRPFFEKGAPKYKSRNNSHRIWRSNLINHLQRTNFNVKGWLTNSKPSPKINK